MVKNKFSNNSLQELNITATKLAQSSEILAALELWDYARVKYPKYHTAITQNIIKALIAAEKFDELFVELKSEQVETKIDPILLEAAYIFLYNKGKYEQLRLLSNIKSAHLPPNINKIIVKCLIEYEQIEDAEYLIEERKINDNEILALLKFNSGQFEDCVAICETEKTASYSQNLISKMSMLKLTAGTEPTVIENSPIESLVYRAVEIFLKGRSSELDSFIQQALIHLIEGHQVSSEIKILFKTLLLFLDDTDGPPVSLQNFVTDKHVSTVFLGGKQIFAIRQCFDDRILQSGKVQFIFNFDHYLSGVNRSNVYARVLSKQLNSIEKGSLVILTFDDFMYKYGLNEDLCGIDLYKPQIESFLETTLEKVSNISNASKFAVGVVTLPVISLNVYEKNIQNNLLKFIQIFNEVLSNLANEWDMEVIEINQAFEDNDKLITSECIINGRYLNATILGRALQIGNKLSKPES